MEMLKTYAKSLQGVPLWGGAVSCVFLAFVFQDAGPAPDILLGLCAFLVGAASFRSAMRPALKSDS